jgi:hypothetical protein
MFNRSICFVTFVFLLFFSGIFLFFDGFYFVLNDLVYFIEWMLLRQIPVDLS